MLATRGLQLGSPPSFRLLSRRGLTGEARTIRSRIFGGSRSVDSLELAATLDGFTYARGLRGKRLRPRGRRVPREEAVLRNHSRSKRRIDRPVRYAETIAARHDRQVAGHHVPSTQFRRRYAPYCSC